jgi:hypothetical protein
MRVEKRRNGKRSKGERERERERMLTARRTSVDERNEGIGGRFKVTKRAPKVRSTLRDWRMRSDETANEQERSAPVQVSTRGIDSSDETSGDHRNVKQRLKRYSNELEMLNNVKVRKPGRAVCRLTDEDEGGRMITSGQDAAIDSSFE